MNKGSDKYCDHCGAKTVRHKHVITKMLVDALRVVAAHQTPIAPIRTLSLSYSERANFPKLKYWGLVTKADPENLKGGSWRVTVKGQDFLAGRLAVPASLMTYRDEVVEVAGEKIFVHEAKGRTRERLDYAMDEQPA